MAEQFIALGEQNPFWEENNSFWEFPSENETILSGGQSNNLYQNWKQSPQEQIIAVELKTAVYKPKIIRTELKKFKRKAFEFAVLRPEFTYKRHQK